MTIAFESIDRERLPMWVLYDRPADYPDQCVARLFYSLHRPEATEHVVTAPADQISQLLRKIPGFMAGHWFWQNPAKVDPPHIMGVLI